MPDSNVCPECGAAVPEDAQQCDLCGTPVTNATSADKEEETVLAEEAATTPSSPASSGEDEGAFCNECGWKNPPGANFCSRCGHELQSLDGSDAAGGSLSGNDTPPGTKPATGPPPEASKEAAPSSEPARREPAPVNDPASSRGMARRVAVVVTVAALVVGGLYGWSAWSGSASPSDGGGETAAAGGGSSPSASNSSPPMMGGGPRGPGTSSSGDATRSGEVPDIIRQQQGGEVPASIAARADSLQNVIETRSGRRKRLARRQLGALFAKNGLTKRAAAQQWQLAQEAGDDLQAWKDAGSLLYNWMVSLNRREQTQKRTEVARLAVDTHQRVLESEPKNYDVRTHLAVAYTETNRPMRGINELKRVLREAPDHVGARLNYGLMQMMIGRHATAIEQFERVRRVAAKNSPEYQRAGTLIEQINKETDGNPQDAPLPGQGSGGQPASNTSGP